METFPVVRRRCRPVPVDREALAVKACVPAARDEEIVKALELEEAGARKRPALLVDLGWTREEAAEARARLLAFETEWDVPGMEEYDRL